MNLEPKEKDQNKIVMVIIGGGKKDRNAGWRNGGRERESSIAELPTRVNEIWVF